MPTNAKQFTALVKRTADRLPADVTSQFMQKIAIDAFLGFTIGTRVDTGRAKGGWRLDIGRRSTDQTNRFLAAGSGPDLATEGGKLTTHRAFQSIHVTNNVEYISHLNDGTATRPGDHFIEDVIDKLAVPLTAAELRPGTFRDG